MSTPWPTTVEEKFAFAEGLKSEGNEWFKKKEYKKAISKYVKVFAYTGTKPTPKMASLMRQKPESEEEKQMAEQIKQLVLSTNLNLSMCYIKIEDYEKAVKFASKALETDTENIKGSFRRGLAYLELGNLDKAEFDLNKAVLLSPNDQSIKHALARLQKQNKKAEMKQRKVFANIFDRAKEEEEEVEEHTQQ